MPAGDFSAGGGCIDGRESVNSQDEIMDEEAPAEQAERTGNQAQAQAQAQAVQPTTNNNVGARCKKMTCKRLANE